MSSQRLRFWNTSVVAAGASAGIIGFIASAYALLGGAQFQLLAKFANELARRCVGWTNRPGDSSSWRPNDDLSSEAGYAFQHVVFANEAVEMLKVAIAVTAISLVILLVALCGRFFEIRRANRKREKTSDRKY